MSDCSETEIRDLLPDLASDNLSSTDAAVVEAHVAQCAACAEEFALLKVVYGMRSASVQFDVASVVSRVNASIATQVATSASSVRSIESAPSKQRSVRAGTWRWAAAIAVVAAGGISIAIARHGAAGMLPVPPVDSLMQTDTMRSAQTTVAVINTPDSAKPTKGASARAASGIERAALSVGELSDLSDTELADVLKNLESWDGAASSDPLVPVPIVKPSGGTQ